MSRTIRPTRLLFIVALAALSQVLGAAPAPAPSSDEREKEKEREPEAPNVEVRFTDGGAMKVRALDAEVTLRTPYGKLVIPVDKINEVECATRLPAAVEKKIKAAVARLDAEELKDREAASAELARLGVKAYHALLEAEKSDVAEVRKRARALLDKVRESVADEGDLESRPNDVVNTVDGSVISGKLEAESLRVETTQFGVVRVRLSALNGERTHKEGLR